MTGLTRRHWLSAAGLLALNGLAGCKSKAANEHLWIGHIGRLSGDERDAGDMAVNAMQMTLADLRERKVAIAGRTIGVRHADAAGKDRARAEASRLLAVNRVACLIVGPRVDGVEDIVGIGRSHGAGVIVLGEVTDPVLVEQAVLLGGDPKSRGEMLARYAYTERKFTHATIMRDGREVLAGVVADSFARQFTQLGGKVIPRVVGFPNIRDTFLPKSDKRSDVVLAATSDRIFTPGRVQSKQALVPIMYAGALAAPPPWLAEAEADRECLWPTLLPEAEILPAEGKEWIERFRKRFEKAPTIEAVLSHDAIALIADALATIKTDDRHKLAEHLSARSGFAGLTGTITRKDGRLVRPLFLLRFEKGKALSTVALATP